MPTAAGTSCTIHPQNLPTNVGDTTYVCQIIKQLVEQHLKTGKVGAQHKLATLAMLRVVGNNKEHSTDIIT